MKLIKPFIILALITLSLGGYTQDTLRYLQGYEELFLPPSDETISTDSLFERHLIFKATDLEKLDSIIFIYNSQKELIYESSNTYQEFNGEIFLKAGKALEHNTYSLIIYLKSGIVNPFIQEDQLLDPFKRRPVEISVDTTAVEEEFFYNP